MRAAEKAGDGSWVAALAVAVHEANGLPIEVIVALHREEGV